VPARQSLRRSPSRLPRVSNAPRHQWSVGLSLPSLADGSDVSLDVRGRQCLTARKRVPQVDLGESVREDAGIAALGPRSLGWDRPGNAERAARSCCRRPT
jgi:hypothetical protein